MNHEILQVIKKLEMRAYYGQDLILSTYEIKLFLDFLYEIIKEKEEYLNRRN